MDKVPKETFSSKDEQLSNVYMKKWSLSWIMKM